MTYLSKNIATSAQEVLKLPHSHYMAYMRHSITSDLRESEEGREILDKWERYMNPRVEADLSAIRNVSGYVTQN